VGENKKMEWGAGGLDAITGSFSPRFWGLGVGALSLLLMAVLLIQIIPELPGVFEQGAVKIKTINNTNKKNRGRV
jgi:hypothetical protein